MYQQHLPGSSSPYEPSTPHLHLVVNMYIAASRNMLVCQAGHLARSNDPCAYPGMASPEKASIPVGTM